jgi:DNA topoisomerase-1
MSTGSRRLMENKFSKKPLKMKSVKKNNIDHLVHDSEKYAKAVDLIYVTDTEPGIERKKTSKGFIYFLSAKQLKDKTELERIKSLVIPPAWENVWICRVHNGHLQVTGLDARKRKQYKYHPLWNRLRNETKFHRLFDFGNCLPKLRLQLEKDLSIPELTQQKVIAAVISVMERTFIRIGNNAYEKEYGSYGLTTLKDQHVKINGGKVEFAFKGKKGVAHKITLKNKKLARIVKQCRDIPGKELFQYKDEKGEQRTIDSGKVNAYIKEITGNDFTAKDFRTWAGTLNALRAFKNLGEADTVAGTKKIIVEALEQVSRQLGNTRTVCKKYYVHPLIISLYENKTLGNYTKQLNEIEKDDSKTDLTSDEKVLMKILKST